MMQAIVYWLEPWEPSPTVVVAELIAAVLFARGARHARVSFSRRAAFWLGLAAIYIALQRGSTITSSMNSSCIDCSISCCITSGRS